MFCWVYIIQLGALIFCYLLMFLHYIYHNLFLLDLDFSNKAPTQFMKYGLYC